MPELRDSFLYHPKGGTPADQLKRLLAGEHSPSWDNLFSTTLEEADAAINEAFKERRKLLQRLLQLRREIRDRKAHKDQVERAAKRFEDTGEIDEMLYPACDKLLAAAKRKFDAEDEPVRASEVDMATAIVKKKLGSDWEVTDSAADDEFVYVTVKTRRTVAAPVRPTREKIVERVRRAFEVYGLAFKGYERPFRVTFYTARGP